MKYSLINNNIFKGNEIPTSNNYNVGTFYWIYNGWFNSLQKCEITESELYNVITYLEDNVHNLKDFPLLSDWERYMNNPIDVTNIIQSHQADGLFEVITLKQDIKPTT